MTDARPGCLRAPCRSHSDRLCRSCAGIARCAANKAAGIANGRAKGSKNYQYGGVKKSGWLLDLIRRSEPGGSLSAAGSGTHDL